MKNLPILLFFLLFLLKTGAAFSQKDSVGGVWLRVEQWPYFPGCAEFDGEQVKKRACSDQKLVDFISSKLVYPPSAIEKGIEGTVIVSFVVEENGAISQPKVVRDLGENCGAAALKVIEAMPKWEPGRQKNEAVRVKMNLPIKFAFKKKESANGRDFNIAWGKILGEKVAVADLKAAIDSPIFVRDADGNALKINELSFVFEKKKKTTLAQTNNPTALDKAMKKVVKKASAGGTFTISATISDGGKFRVVEKSFLITE